MCTALDNCFVLSGAETALHPSVMATVLDSAMKGCESFPEILQNVCTRAYADVTSEATISLLPKMDEG